MIAARFDKQQSVLLLFWLVPVVLASVFHENNQSKTAVKLTVLAGLSASLLFIAEKFTGNLYPATGRSFDQDDCQKWRDSGCVCFFI